jgi:hypothetical protein
MKCPYCKHIFPGDDETCPACGRGFAHLREFGIDYSHTPKININVNFSKISRENEGTVTITPDEPYVSVSAGPSLTLREYVIRPFKDPGILKKILTGYALLLVPFIGFIVVTGYLIDYSNRIINRKDADELPEWRNLKNFLDNGLHGAAAVVVYIFLYLLVSLVILFPFKNSIVSLPVGLSGMEVPIFNPALIAVMIIPLSIIFLITLVFTILVPVLFVLYSRTYDYEEFYKFKEAVSLIFSNFLEFNILMAAMSIVWLPVTLIMFPLMAISSALAIMVFPLLFFLAMLVTVSSIGEFYYKTKIG